MAKSKDDNSNNSGGVRLSGKLVGQFILWAFIITVGGVVTFTLSHDKAIALMEQRLSSCEDRLENAEIDIDELKHEMIRHEEHLKATQ